MRRTGIVIALVLASLVISGCGTGSASPDAGAGVTAISEGGAGPNDGASSGTCAPHQLPSGWAPAWKPPKSPTPGACTDQKIQRYYEVCEDARLTNPVPCHDFTSDPANETCIGCLFSKSDEKSYGPIVLQGNAWRANIDGCIALLTGDFDETGCAAKLQAIVQCRESACLDVCPDFDSFLACWGAAGDVSCRSYVLDANCVSSPRYAVCTGNPTSKASFLTIGRLFCGTGFPDAGAGDGG